MTTAYLAISILKKSKTPPNQLNIFLIYVNQKALKEYLNISGIYRGKKKFTSLELIDLIINGNKSNNVTKNNELTIDEVNNILMDTQE